MITIHEHLFRLLFLTILMTLFPLSLLQAEAGTYSAQTDAEVEAILGMDSCSDYNWELSSDGSYWVALNISYVAYPVNTAYQTMSIFVPAAYMIKESNCNVVFTDSVINVYNVNTAPILYLCEAPGYSEVMAGSRVDTRAIASGYIAVNPGHRGKGTTSTDSTGKIYYDGKSPWCLIDLKAGIRYLRFNDKVLPGNSERIVTSASSGGGAMSTFLACCANDPVYNDYLKEAGAVISVGDDVYASNCYCPITNVANSDAAYEWFFGTKSHLETLGCTHFQVLLSGYLSNGFVDYLNNLGYTEEAFKNILIDQLEWSANYYLQELKNGETEVDWSDKAVFADADHPTLEEIAKNYIAGYYIKTGGMRGGMPGGPPGGTGGPPGSGMSTEGKDISNWMAWDDVIQSVVITSLEKFQDYFQRIKGVTSFDGLNGQSTENQPFGDRNTNFKHFSNAILDVLTTHHENLQAAWTDVDAQNTGYASFADLYTAFQSDVADGDCDAYGNDIVDLYNPMLFIDGDTSYLNGDVAKHVRIRHGTADAHTALPIITLMGLTLEKAGVDLNFEYVWEAGHGSVEQENQTLYEWIDEICASVGTK
ncbi:hypothetical protein JW824_00335 [bacterium]|nr:hypothetical protein [bacterium]RQV99330.1 MAG: hypothetical protein EH221_00365 [bacterium]